MTRTKGRPTFGPAVRPDEPAGAGPRPVRGRRLTVLLTAVGLLTSVGLSGCSGEPDPLDQDQARRALLTAAEMPDPGWSLLQASERAPEPTAVGADLAGGPCQDALHLLDTLGASAPVWVKATYSKPAEPVVDLVVKAYPQVPGEITRMREVITRCTSGRLAPTAGALPFTLVAPDYPRSGATGARLTVQTPQGPRLLDVAVVVHGSAVVVATAEGVTSAAPDLLDRVVAAQRSKLESVARG